MILRSGGNLAPLPALLALAVSVSLLAVACGSSKPDYCSNVSDLEGSVEELGSVKLESGALETVRTDLEEIRTNADNVVRSAKEDFPSETSAVKSSVSNLAAAIEALPPAPTAQQLVALGAAVQRTVTASEELSGATESACD
jgi:hypothetical protein